MDPILPSGDYRYEIRRYGGVIAVEQGSVTPQIISGVRTADGGTNHLEAEAALDEEGSISRVKIGYSRGFFRRNAVYEADGDTLRGSITALAGRNEIVVKLGRFREIDAELALFRALLIARIRRRGLVRWTGRVAVIDAATLVAASLKQTCRCADDTGLRWIYEARMGDTEEIELDLEGRLINRRDSNGATVRLVAFAPGRL
ncbi:MAG: hypothetical protein ABSG46_16325 [Candidatus Binataceae bacterium]